MTKVSPKVERIFAHAVALEQSGRMRNTVFCIQNRIYVLNFDHTVMLRFVLPKNEKTFDRPVAFRANDYDSNVFREEDGKIIFESEQSGFTRKKTCLAPDRTPEDVEERWKKLSAVEREEDGDWIPLPKTILDLLEENLSHVEFVGKTGEPVKIIQRDIYSGSKIEIQESSKSLISNKLKFDFGPLAMRTGDLSALYSFQDVIYIRFVGKKGGSDFIRIKGRPASGAWAMEGFIGCCLYDEMFELGEANDHGRQEQENRRREQEAHPAVKRKGSVLRRN